MTFIGPLISLVFIFFSTSFLFIFVDPNLTPALATISIILIFIVFWTITPYIVLSGMSAKELSDFSDIFNFRKQMINMSFEIKVVPPKIYLMNYPYSIYFKISNKKSIIAIPLKPYIISDVNLVRIKEQLKNKILMKRFIITLNLFFLIPAYFIFKFTNTFLGRYFDIILRPIIFLLIGFCLMNISFLQKGLVVDFLPKYLGLKTKDFWEFFKIYILSSYGVELKDKT